MSSSTETHSDLARTAEALRNEFQRRMNTLRRQLDDDFKQATAASEQRVVDLAERLDQGEARVAGIVDAYDEMRRQTDGELRGARQAIARLTGEIHLIEGRLRLEHGVQPVDLDAVATELTKLVAQVRAVEQIRAGMLDERGRGKCEAVLTAYAELKRLGAQSRNRALDASGELARAKAGSRAFRTAAAAYRLHWGQFRSRERDLDREAPGYADADSALRRDAELREAFASQRGADAITDLTAHLRRKVDIAVETHALFPAWFTITELGHRPSATRSAQWRDVATQVVLYRITFRVTHAVLALGDPPAGRYQSERYTAIRAALRELDG
ncbi:hypothetical protein [Actinoplanes sp. NPDC051494]|uniref:hypothetical protein n=1 Tax=Actinoplanes sp. NPDC051494 TaxID=3363907 RepID=UPI0037ABB45B